MTGVGVATVLVAVSCYGVASVLRVELSNGRRVTGVAAFGPAVIALGPQGHDLAPLWVLLGSAVAVQAVAMGLRRAGWGQFIATSVLLVLSAGVFGVFADVLADGSFGASFRGPLLVATLMATAPYGVADLVMRSRGPRAVGGLRAALRWEVPLYLVLGSTAGLVVLAFDPLGWVSFPLLLLALLVTWHEFHRFAEARQTYEQTVGAMGKLAERAGYAPVGYHERVAALAAKVGHELELDWDRIRALTLVGRLQRVGAVSLAEPGGFESVDPSLVEERGRRVLEETGYLAPYAHFLAPQSEGLSIEGEILRAVGRFVQVEGLVADPLAHLRDEGGVRTEILEALDGCVRVTSPQR